MARYVRHKTYKGIKIIVKKYKRGNKVKFLASANGYDTVFSEDQSLIMQIMIDKINGDVGNRQTI